MDISGQVVTVASDVVNNQHVYMNLITAFMAFCWGVIIITKMRPISPAQKFGSYSLFFMAATSVAYTLYFTTSTQDYLWVTAMYTIVAAIYTCFYYLHVRLLTGLYDIRKVDMWIFVVPVLLVIFYSILAFVLDEDGEKYFMQCIRDQKLWDYGTPTVMFFTRMVMVISYSSSLFILFVFIWSIRKKYLYYQVLNEFLAQSDGLRRRNYFSSIMFECIQICFLVMTFFATAVFQSSLVVILVQTMLSVLSVSILGSNILHTRFTAFDIHNSIVDSSSSASKTAVKNVYKEIYAAAKQKGSVSAESHRFISHGKQDFGSEKSSDSSEFLPKIVINRIKTDKLFIDPELNLMTLANKLGVGRLQLSQSIHHYYSTTLSGLVMKLRIEYAAELLDSENKDKRDFQDLAAKVGYANVVPFCRDFSTVMKMTPRQYLEQK